MSDRKLRVDFDEEKIDSIFAKVDQSRLPGAAVGIAIGGKPVYRKGFGLANMELPLVLSPSIRMRIGSITKHFTCLAYLLLCEGGKADIDDPLGKHLPELHPVTHKVTIRQLMGHLGGLRDPCSIKIQFAGPRGRSDANVSLLSLYREVDDVNFAPGTTRMYSNGGFVLLTAVIERLTGQGLEDVLRERIFVPVGMTDTLVRRLDTDFLPNSATSHMTSATGDFERAYWGMDFAGGGAMVSTIDDMLRWLAHMDAPVVGSRETWSLIKTPQALRNGTVTSYGLGLRNYQYRGAQVLNHGGGWLGANAQMLKVPAASLDVMIMVNRHDVSALLLGDEVLDACLPDLEPAVAAGPFTYATGTFRSLRSRRVIQLFARDERQIVSIDGYELPFLHDSDGVLRPDIWKDLKWSVTLSGDRAEPEAIRFDDFGSLDDMARIAIDEPDVLAILGRYRSDKTGVDATISRGGNGARLSTESRFGTAEFDLEYLGEAIWCGKQIGALEFLGTTLSAILSFNETGGGFHWSSGDTRLLPFRRVA